MIYHAIEVVYVKLHHSSLIITIYVVTNNNSYRSSLPSFQSGTSAPDTTVFGWAASTAECYGRPLLLWCSHESGWTEGQLSFPTTCHTRKPATNCLSLIKAANSSGQWNWVLHHQSYAMRVAVLAVTFSWNLIILYIYIHWVIEVRLFCCGGMIISPLCSPPRSTTLLTEPLGTKSGIQEPPTDK